MLRTASRKAMENVRKYVVEHYDGSGYDDNTPEAKAQTFEEIATVIYLDVMRVESYKLNLRWLPFEKLFSDWAMGLPGLLDTCYYYNRSAVDDLGAILEQTEAEKSKYNEREAETMLSNLIAREIIKAVKV